MLMVGSTASKMGRMTQERYSGKSLVQKVALFVAFVVWKLIMSI